MLVSLTVERRLFSSLSASTWHMVCLTKAWLLTYFCHLSCAQLLCLQQTCICALSLSLPHNVMFIQGVSNRHVSVLYLYHTMSCHTGRLQQTCICALSLSTTQCHVIQGVSNRHVSVLYLYHTMSCHTGCLQQTCICALSLSLPHNVMSYRVSPTDMYLCSISLYHTMSCHTGCLQQTCICALSLPHNVMSYRVSPNRTCICALSLSTTQCHVIQGVSNRHVSVLYLSLYHTMSCHTGCLQQTCICALSLSTHTMSCHTGCLQQTCICALSLLYHTMSCHTGCLQQTCICALSLSTTQCHVIQGVSNRHVSVLYLSLPHNVMSYRVSPNRHVSVLSLYHTMSCHTGCLQQTCICALSLSTTQCHVIQGVSNRHVSVLSLYHTMSCHTGCLQQTCICALSLSTTQCHVIQGVSNRHVSVLYLSLPHNVMSYRVSPTDMYLCSISLYHTMSCHTGCLQQTCICALSISTTQCHVIQGVSNRHVSVLYLSLPHNVMSYRASPTDMYLCSIYLYHTMSCHTGCLQQTCICALSLSTTQCHVIQGVSNRHVSVLYLSLPHNVMSYRVSPTDMYLCSLSTTQCHVIQGVSKKRGAKNTAWNSTSQCTYYEVQLSIFHLPGHNKKLISV